MRNYQDRLKAERVIETIIDQHSLDTVMEMLEDIAYAKAEHITEVYGQGDQTAHKWAVSAKRLGKLKGFGH
jgi:nitrogen regulatory protein PII